MMKFVDFAIVTTMTMINGMPTILFSHRDGAVVFLIL